MIKAVLPLLFNEEMPSLICNFFFTDSKYETYVIDDLKNRRRATLDYIPHDSSKLHHEKKCCCADKHRTNHVPVLSQSHRVLPQ